MRSDAELRQDVMTGLQWEPTIKAAEIGVGVKDGVVTLSGYADNFYERWAAERAAARVFGVRAVAEELKARLPGSLERSDQDIVRAASDALEWSVLMPHEKWFSSHITVNPTVQPQDVKDKIVSSFERKSLLDARRITVEIRGAWVILRGSVHSWVERAEAQWAAFTAQGVFDVENDIIISP